MMRTVKAFIPSTPDTHGRAASDRLAVTHGRRRSAGEEKFSPDIRAVLTEAINGIGERDFAARVADMLRRHAGFDLAAVMAHQPQGRSDILFENFSQAGHRSGLELYADETHRFNPMLARARGRAVRARDYRMKPQDLSGVLSASLLRIPDEELGFRTLGWPERQEELGLYLQGGNNIIEVGLYRERCSRSASARLLRDLDEIADPLGAAFKRHAVLTDRYQDIRAPLPSSMPSILTVRETEVCALLISGCSSAAIASRLSISRHTVKDHRKNIFRKLAVASLAELFAITR